MLKEDMKFYVRCDCGCSILEFGRFIWDDEPAEYFITTYTIAENQEGVNMWYKIKRRLCMAFEILRTGRTLRQEIILAQKDVDELRENLKDF